jgi:anti-sigma-K factor RskA
MTADLHSLVAPYALDALEDDERGQFEAHLEDCADCRAELAGFRATAARLGGASSHTPPAALRDRLLAAVSTTPQERPLATLTQRSRLRRTLPRLAVAAAFLIGAVGVGGFLVERDNAQDEHNRNVAITAVLSAPDAQTVAKTFPSGGNVRMVMSASKDTAVIFANDLPSPGKGKVYQVWMIDDSGPNDQGTFTTSGEMVMKGVTKADRVAVTVEPEGGSKLPTTPPIATIPI